MSEEPMVIHDGHAISECNDAFCALFRCERSAVLALQMEEIISDEDLRALAVWRGKHIMAHAENKEFHQQYTFLRCDGTSFWGEAISQRIGADQYQTRIKWLYDEL